MLTSNCRTCEGNQIAHSPSRNDNNHTLQCPYDSPHKPIPMKVYFAGTWNVVGSRTRSVNS
jgi:hypothetical protein